MKLHNQGMTNLVETPNMTDLVDQTKNYQLSQDLLQQVMKLAAQRGFRIYRHSVGPSAKEFRLLLMCAHY